MLDVTGRPRGGALGVHDVQAFPSYQRRDVFVRGYPRDGSLGAHDVQGRPAVLFRAEPPAPGGFPVQVAGLRAYYGGAVRELCMVALADAPAGMGGRLTIDKNGTLYAVYLVATSDPDASPIRIAVSPTTTRAIRRKT